MSTTVVKIVRDSFSGKKYIAVGAQPFSPYIPSR